MRSFLEEYSRLVGLLLLSFVFIFLFSTPSMILAKTITTIDTELSRASGAATPVRTLLDFGNNEHIQAFPRQVGEWTAANDYNTTQVAESLGAEVVLLRAYKHPKFYQPVIFLIVQSNARSSFHPPIVCYPAMGYEIEEEGKARIEVQNLSWVEKPLYAAWAGEGTGGERAGAASRNFNDTISAKKLVVVKKAAAGEVTERLVVLYFYVKESPFTSENITLVRVSALAPTKGSYDGVLGVTKEFLGESVPRMFEPRREEERVIFILLGLGSVVGKVAVGLLLLLPLLLLFYPQIKRLI